MEQIAVPGQVFFGFVRAVILDQGLEVDARRKTRFDVLEGLLQQGLAFRLQLRKPGFPARHGGLIRAVVLGPQLLQVVQVLHLGGGDGQLLKGGGHGLNGTGELLFEALGGLGRFLGIIQRDLTNVAVAFRDVEGFAVGGDDLLFKQGHIVLVPFPLRRDEPFLVIGVHLLLGDGDVRAEQVHGAVVALRRHELIIDGLDGIALRVHDVGHVLLRHLFVALLHPLVEDLPELLILVLGRALEQLVLRLGEVVFPGFRQLVFDQAHVDELLDGGLHARLPILVGHGGVKQRAGHIQRVVQGRLHHAEGVADASDPHHDGVLRRRLAPRGRNHRKHQDKDQQINRASLGAHLHSPLFYASRPIILSSVVTVFSR